jgi:hypothetical protein
MAAKAAIQQASVREPKDRMPALRGHDKPCGLYWGAVFVALGLYFSVIP